MRTAAAVALLLFASSSSLAAQQWSVDAQAGRMRATLDPSATESQSFVLGVRYSDLLSQFRVAGGVPTKSDEALWGSIGGARRVALRQRVFVAGVDLGANGFLMHDRAERTQEVPVPGPFGGTRLERAPALSGYAVAGQAMPLIGVELARVQAHVRAGVSSYSSKFGEVTRDRTVQMADAQLTFTPSPSVGIMPAIRRVNADEGGYTYAALTGIAAIGNASLWGSAGQWLNLDSTGTAFSAGASLRLAGRATFSVSAAREVFDPLYLTPAQTAWSAGVSVRLGRPATRAAPVPSSYENGVATIELPATKTKATPRIAGDFNNWKPQPMRWVNGMWTFAVPVAPGVYNYAFVDEHDVWFVPEKHPGRKDDGMGGYVAVLVVQ